MAAVLYLALSNNIRGIAEYFSSIRNLTGFVKPLTGFVKPSGAELYVQLVRQCMDRSVPNILFMAEATLQLSLEPRTFAESKFPIVTKQLRDSGFTFPIVCASNRMASQAHIDFLDAGGNVLLPLGRRNENQPYTVSPLLLDAQVRQLTKGQSLLETGESLASKASEKTTFQQFMETPSYFGLTVDIQDNVCLYDKQIDLTPQKRKLLGALVRAKGNLVSKHEMSAVLYGNEHTASDSNLRNYISDIREKIKETIAGLGVEFGLSIIDNRAGEGWRLNATNLYKLATIIAPETLGNKFARMLPMPPVKTLRSSVISLSFKDFSHDVSGQKILFRGLPLDIAHMRVKVITAIFRLDGALISGNRLFEECYPPGSTMGRTSLYQLVGRASENLSKELTKLGYELEEPLITPISKMGWAANHNALKRLENKKPTVPEFIPTDTLLALDYSQ